MTSECAKKNYAVAWRNQSTLRIVKPIGHIHYPIRCTYRTFYFGSFVYHLYQGADNTATPKNRNK